MQVLLAVENLFSVVGGGQSFYSDLVRNTPECRFYYPSDADEEALRPANAFPFRVGMRYRSLQRDLRLEGRPKLAALTAECITGVLYQLDLAAAVVGLRFDIVDIPDFTPMAACLPGALERFGIRVRAVAASLHGLLSSTIGEPRGGSPECPTADILRSSEDALFCAAETRYAISSEYLRARETDTGTRGRLLDLAGVFPFGELSSIRRSAQGRLQSASSRPDLVFLGRQEFAKGPDLFVDFASAQDSEKYGSLFLVGPELDDGNGTSSRERLSRLAEGLGLALRFDCLPRRELWRKLANWRCVAVLPSRRDTLNLAGLEAVFLGVPLVISHRAGLCSYLEQAFPGLPFTKLDIDDPESVQRALFDVLEAYERNVADLGGYVRAALPIRLGDGISDIYRDAQFALADRARIDSFSTLVGEVLDQEEMERRPFLTVYPYQETVEASAPVAGNWSPLNELAGIQDSAEVLSACLSEDNHVDFEAAWRTNSLFQLEQLITESGFDIAIENSPALADRVCEAFDLAQGGVGRRSLVMVGAPPTRAQVAARVYGSGAVKRAGPALAASRIVLVMEDEELPERALGRLLRAIAVGNPVVASSSLIGRAGRALPGVDLSSIVASADMQGLFDAACVLLEDDLLLADRRQRANGLATELAIAQWHEQSADVPYPSSWREVPSVQLPEIFDSNRTLREVFETSGLSGVASLCDTVGDHANLLRELHFFLFVQRSAPALATGEAIFRKINDG